MDNVWAGETSDFALRVRLSSISVGAFLDERSTSLDLQDARLTSGSDACEVIASKPIVLQHLSHAHVFWRYFASHQFCGARMCSLLVCRINVIDQCTYRGCSL